MCKRILLIMTILIAIPLSGQAQEPTTIHSCLHQFGVPVSMEYFPESSFRDWVREDDPAEFLALDYVSRIEFAGYAPDRYRYLEWYGGDYGWRGVNMLNWSDRGWLLFYDRPIDQKDKVVVARAYIAGYPPLNTYQIWITNLEETTDARGKHPGYHLGEQADGTICAFQVDEWEFWLAMGWESES